MVNLSGLDRMVHVLLGALVAIASLMMNESLWSVTVLIIGIAIVLMGVIGWSGIYSILNISTKKPAHSKISGNDIKKAVKGHMEIKSSSISSKPTTTKKKVVKKPAVKKVPAKKVAAKKTTTTTKKVATKKTPAKKSPAKKVTKASTSKTTTKKAVTKKPAAKKVTKKTK